MATQIASLARHTGIYGAGTVVGGIARAALVPIIARYLPAEEYGKASVILVFVALLAIGSELGLAASLIKFVNEARSDEEKRRVVSTILLGSLALAIPVAVVAGVLFTHLSSLLLGSGQYGALVLVGVVGGFGNAMLQVGLAFERALARSFGYFLYTLVKGVISLALSIVLVVGLDLGAAGLLVGAALPPLVIGIVIYARLLRRCGITFSRATFKAVFEFGGPLVPMNLAMWVLASSDIYLLRRFAAGAQGLPEVGLYQYAHEICLLLVLPVTALSLAWPQFIFSNYAQPDGPRMFARVGRYFAFFLIEAAFLLSIFSRQIVGLVGSAQYLGSAEVIPLLAGSLTCYGLSVIFATGLYVTGKTRVLAGIVACCAAVNVGLNIVLIPVMGKEGAALATMVTNLAMMAAVLALAQASYSIPFAVRRTLAGLAVAGAVLAAMDVASTRHAMLAGVLPKLLAACGFTLALLASLDMRPGDLRSALRVLMPVVRPPTP